ncbi:Ycf66 family protein [Desertifilum sp. FACHB-1129]|uniref:Ycf66 family protein n=1 Tax=Desertifilum tharense IPPAS B-1220 TaxID=1781255 RepID=A0A1E5QN69_9CYAN|nr:MULTISPECIES: Ycf66 family protein [Desertifilum]MCD8490054.1 Ycf66 family protein [Desertifilum sp.]MDA0208613.1 Ycf66 family protein [Cyanobacteria bacterium FC1]MBD2312435.1 Ycf66 family protein [Desertifilum sp. FACHB-1129]MBD2321218.1 Ycf66 family protein [Desertifilum sp. FACHB-866]MBD2331475.1 Ycf66 family protein [Desertifilum sp. FACHB-868]
MVNVGLNPGAMLGIVLFVAGAGLYFLRSVRPELARDHDIFFMAVAVLSGGILFFQGWRLDPILTFGQFLLTGSAIFFAVESIRLRGLATAQAKRSTPIVDDDRPVSPVYDYYSYKAELDELEPLEEEQPIPRRIRGTRVARPGRTDDYEEDAPARPARRSSSANGGRPPSGGSTPRKRRPRPDERSTRRPEDWDSSPSYGDDYPYGDATGSSVPETPTRPPSSRPRRPRPRPDTPPPRAERDSKPTDYVDYQPIESSDDDEADNSNNFDY